jgi:hypothetical protein
VKSVSSWNYVVLNDWMIVNTELKRVRKETVVV